MARLVERLLFAVGEVVMVGFTGKASKRNNFFHAKTGIFHTKV